MRLQRVQEHDNRFQLEDLAAILATLKNTAKSLPAYLLREYLGYGKTMPLVFK